LFAITVSFFLFESFGYNCELFVALIIVSDDAMEEESSKERLADADITGLLLAIVVLGMIRVFCLLRALIFLNKFIILDNLAKGG